MPSFLRVISLSVMIGASLTVVSCGGDDGDGGTRPDNVPSIGGNWQMTGALSYSLLGQTANCQMAGKLSITQSAKTFTGNVSESTVTCTGLGGTVTGNVDGPLSNGQISGNTATYSNASCNFTGTISGSPANRAEGSATCNVAVQNQTYPFTGTWQATR